MNEMPLLSSFLTFGRHFMVKRQNRLTQHQVLSSEAHLFSFSLELSQFILGQRQEVVIVFWVLLPAHGLQQPTQTVILLLYHSASNESVCVCWSWVVTSVPPVLCLQGAGQVFSVWVTEGVGQTIFMADFLAVGFGLWGAAFTLTTFTKEEI